jgi:hypothetical protein
MKLQPRVLFEANEMTLENLMRGPLVEIAEDLRMPYGTRRFRANKAGFVKYAPLFETYACNSLAVSSDDIAEDSFFESFDLDLESLPVDQIRELFLGGMTRFPPDYDYSVFREMTSVHQLITDTLSYKTDLLQYFPRLEALLNFDWKSNRVTKLGSSWPELKYLHIQGFNDDLGIFAGRHIRRLFLIGGSLSSLDGLAHFQDLDTLMIAGQRKALDLSPIARLPNLRNLAILGNKKFTGWENFGSATVQTLELGWAPSADVMAAFPALTRCNIQQTPQDRYGVGRDWELDRFDYPFSLVVPAQQIG